VEVVQIELVAVVHVLDSGARVVQGVVVSVGMMQLLQAVMVVVTVG